MLAPPARQELPRARRGLAPAVAAALAPALERSPCIISFSGGRDSSAVLAVGIAVGARAEGLPSPFCSPSATPGSPSDESEWREAVRGSGISGSRLDQARARPGLHSRRVLRQHAVAPPAASNAGCCGGAAVTGVGGDEVMGSGRSRRRRVRARPRGTAGTRTSCASAAAAPIRARQRVLRRRFRALGPGGPNPGAARDGSRRSVGAEPLHLGPRLSWWLGLPYTPRRSAEHGLPRIHPLGFLSCSPSGRSPSRTDATPAALRRPRLRTAWLTFPPSGASRALRKAPRGDAGSETPRLFRGRGPGPSRTSSTTPLLQSAVGVPGWRQPSWWSPRNAW